MSVVDFVRGRVVERTGDSVVIAVGGFGLRAHVGAATAGALPEPGEEALLYTYLYLREDLMALYGFATQEERLLFTQLLSVSGVGPKVALAALSSGPTERLAAAVSAGDVDALARIPGIGRKTAQRIVLDLKGKLVTPISAAATGAPGGTHPILETVAAALRDFGGYGPTEVAAVLAALPQDRELTEEEALRLAFQHMGARR